MKNIIKGLVIVDVIGKNKGTFQAVIKVPAGFLTIQELGSDIPYLQRWKKGALQTIVFRPDDGACYLTVFARKGKKIIIMDKAIAKDLKVGVVNQLFFDTNLLDQNQYKAVNARTWDDKVFIINENNL